MRIVGEADQLPISLIALDWTDEDVLQVPLFRLAAGRLMGTLARHLLMNLVRESAQRGRLATAVSDRFPSGSVLSAMTELGFLGERSVRVRFNLRDLLTRRDFVKRLRRVSGMHRETALRVAAEASKRSDLGYWFHLETRFWPAKFTDLDIPCFIVPIRPGWARDLLGLGDALFDTEAKIALAHENAYYRAARPHVLQAPARLVWYVSSSDKRIRAVSRLEEIAVGPPKELFRRFRHLGIYTWEKVLQTAGDNHNREMMALRFKDTEVFDVPVRRSLMCEIMTNHGERNTQIQSPTAISTKTFIDLYREGFSNRR